MDEVKADDLKRDLQADLSVCELAPCGPWTKSGNRHESDHPTTNALTLEASVYPSLESRAGGPLFIADQDECDLAGWMVSAREGWPAAIRRALAAEADAAQLRETVHALEMENHTLRQELSQTTTQGDALGRMQRQLSAMAMDALSAQTQAHDSYLSLVVLRDAARAVLPLLRDRFDGTEDEPLVDALEHALVGKE